MKSHTPKKKNPLRIVVLLGIIIISDAGGGLGGVGVLLLLTAATTSFIIGLGLEDRSPLATAPLESGRVSAAITII